jgi:iron(III) transport system ATP-binding protein
MTAPLTLEGVHHAYGDRAVLGGVDVSLSAGELLAVLGASGDGKTTLLRCVAGLVCPDRGTVTVGGQCVARDGVEHIRTEDRKVGLVFQDYALFPSLTVFENVGFGVQDDARVRALLLDAGLVDHASRYPHQLSGGEQQRVALMRALAPRPSVLLMDEPFANLDAARRQSIGATVKRALKEAGTAALFVTHDRVDALYLADRVAVLVPGAKGSVVGQVGTPQEVYTNPVSAQVARLTGDVTELTSLDGLMVEERTGASGADTRWLVRPEDVSLTVGEGVGVVRSSGYLGGVWRAEVGVGEARLWCDLLSPLAEGQTVAVRLRRAHGVPA